MHPLIPNLLSQQNQVNNVVLVSTSNVQWQWNGITAFPGVTKPAGAAVGDVLILGSASDVTGGWAAPSGFTDLFGTTDFAAACYRVITGSESSVLKHSNGGAKQTTLAMLFRNCTMGAIGAGVHVSGATNAVASSITPTAVGTLLAFFAGSTAQVLSTPSGMTAAGVLSTKLAVGGFTQSVNPGATGTRTSSVATADELISGMLSLDSL